MEYGIQSKEIVSQVPYSVSRNIKMLCTGCPLHSWSYDSYCMHTYLFAFVCTYVRMYICMCVHFVFLSSFQQADTPQ